MTKGKPGRSYKKITLKAGEGVLLPADEIHRVDFGKGSTVKAFLFCPVDKDLPEQGEIADIYNFKVTGVYSDKDIKVVKVEGKSDFPEHRHPGKEWLEVTKGSVMVYYYRTILAIGLLWLIIKGGKI